MKQPGSDSASDLTRLFKIKWCCMFDYSSPDGRDQFIDQDVNQSTRRCEIFSLLKMFKSSVQTCLSSVEGNTEENVSYFTKNVSYLKSVSQLQVIAATFELLVFLFSFASVSCRTPYFCFVAVGWICGRCSSHFPADRSSLFFLCLLDCSSCSPSFCSETLWFLSSLSSTDFLSFFSGCLYLCDPPWSS